MTVPITTYSLPNEWKRELKIEVLEVLRSYLLGGGAFMLFNWMYFNESCYPHKSSTICSSCYGQTTSSKVKLNSPPPVEHACHNLYHITVHLLDWSILTSHDQSFLGPGTICAHPMQLHGTVMIHTYILKKGMASLLVILLMWQLLRQTLLLSPLVHGHIPHTVHHCSQCNSRKRPF